MSYKWKYSVMASCEVPHIVGVKMCLLIIL